MLKKWQKWIGFFHIQVVMNGRNRISNTAYRAYRNAFVQPGSALTPLRQPVQVELVSLFYVNTLEYLKS
jgi:hypothetical protein